MSDSGPALPLSAPAPASQPQPFLSREERMAKGKAFREAVPRESHAEWSPPPDRRHPLEILQQSNQERVQELVPIRYGRMLRSPFTFLRGSAGLMAADLALTPSTGVRVQACGDCHFLNFGLFATPERNLIFDINDFDETLPAPWEWDLKRLAVSFVVGGRDLGLSDKEARVAVKTCVATYRELMSDYASMNPLDIWYDRLDEARLIEMAPDEETEKRRRKLADKARQRIGETLFPKITTQVGGRHRLLDQPPVLYHVEEPDAEERVAQALEAYRLSLPEERRVLFDRYRLEDIAVKVVGIGSVGTRCFVGLFFSADNHPLLLQFKEASSSVLEPYAGRSIYSNHGQRVVVGQRMMQSSSDMFLGWTHSDRGFNFFGRQLRDMKFSPSLVSVTAATLKAYADLCGRTLARAHARTGDAAVICGYLGKGDAFDHAISEFAEIYADQNQRDHATLVEAVKEGRLEATVEEDL